MKFSKSIVLLAGLSCLPNMAFALTSASVTCPDSGESIEMTLTATGGLKSTTLPYSGKLTFAYGKQGFPENTFYCHYTDPDGHDIFLRTTLEGGKNCKPSGTNDQTLTCD